MFNSQEMFITTNNSMQNLGSAGLTAASRWGNLSVESPTVADVNAAVATGDELLLKVEQEGAEVSKDDEPAFGTHIREAAQTLRRVLGG